MVKVIGKLSQFRASKILLVGDFMLDTYTSGKIKRISPEAPVPVLHVEENASRPGGAGNVALNLVSLGCQVKVAGRIGWDAAGQTLLKALQAEEIDVTFLLQQDAYITPVKNRLIADFQQLLRVDVEMSLPFCVQLENHIVASMDILLDDCDVVAISDYAKGFLTKKILTVLIQHAKLRKIPVVIDPKGTDFAKYAGATVIKPNLKEAYEASYLPENTPLEEVAAALFATCSMDKLLITRSEHGITVFDKKKERQDFPVRAHEVKDVTGAGDTVLAVICASMASGLTIQDAAALANVAACIAIEKVGCVRVTLADMAERLLQLDMQSKIFDEEHLFALKHSLQGKKITILGLDSQQHLSPQLFQWIKSLSAKDDSAKLILYLCDEHPSIDFVNMLSSLREVDFVVLKNETLRNLSENLKPAHVYLLSEGTLTEVEHPLHLLERLASLATSASLRAQQALRTSGL